jgi:hypothetical protein
MPNFFLTLSPESLVYRVHSSTLNPPQNARYLDGGGFISLHRSRIQESMPSAYEMGFGILNLRGGGFRLGRQLAAVARAGIERLDFGDKPPCHLEQNGKCPLVRSAPGLQPRHSDRLG